MCSHRAGVPLSRLHRYFQQVNKTNSGIVRGLFQGPIHVFTMTFQFTFVMDTFCAYRQELFLIFFGASIAFTLKPEM